MFGVSDLGLCSNSGPRSKSPGKTLIQTIIAQSVLEMRVILVLRSIHVGGVGAEE